MKVCPVCCSPVHVLVQAQLLAEQDDDGNWVLVTDNLDQNLVNDACEQPGNPCQCTNQHCGMPTFGNGDIPLSIYDIDDVGYLFPWIRARYGIPFAQTYYAGDLIKQFQTTNSLSPDVTDQYNAWYDKLRQNPVAIYELCVNSYVPAWIAMSGKLPTEKVALLQRHTVPDSLPDELRAEYNDWYSKLEWKPWIGYVKDAKDIG